ncbi:MAG: ABC transporter permease [Propionibacteriaceae bacterium]|jgi:peptide/nickel transport system permease protein|nr:ABC transporter permease [Propionibacteriaceae bacterium]
MSENTTGTTPGRDPNKDATIVTGSASAATATSSATDATTAGAADATAPKKSGRLTRGQLTWRRFLRNKTAVVGAIGILILVFMAVVGPHLSYWKYLDIDTANFLQPPSSNHLFGTTQAGRDVLAMTLHGLSRSLLIGFFVAIVSALIATLVGTTAAYFGGWVERILLWLIDLLLIVPFFLIVAVVTKGFDASGNAAWVMLAFVLAILGWMVTARVVRSMTQSLLNKEYILAARYMGMSSGGIIVRHIVPNISSLLIINIALGVGGAILSETGLSFLGLGVQPPDVSLGSLISQGSRMATTFPWIFGFPAIILVILVLCVNAVGDGIRDALDPTSASGGVLTLTDEDEDESLVPTEVAIPLDAEDARERDIRKAQA